MRVRVRMRWCACMQVINNNAHVVRVHAQPCAVRGALLWRIVNVLEADVWCHRPRTWDTGVTLPHPQTDRRLHLVRRRS